MTKIFLSILLLLTIHLKTSFASPSDIAQINRYRSQLNNLLTYMKKESSIFPQKKISNIRMLSRSQKETVWQTWQSFLDIMFILEAKKQSYRKFYDLKKLELKEETFHLFYYTFLTQYSYALKFINIIENDPNLDIVLNEHVPEIGLLKNTYKDFKYQFLNIIIATEFLTLNTLYQFYNKPTSPLLQQTMEDDIDFLWKMGKGKGEKLTLKNALTIVRKVGFSVWFPIQTGVSEWMGDTKVYRKNICLITNKQIKTILAKLNPGDILLERRNWFLSNVGLPGYWPHVALFVGTKKERNRFFKDDPSVMAWVKKQGEPSGNFETLLKKTYPETYKKSLTPLEDHHKARVLEALSEGIIFTTIEHSADADSLAALRPRLSKKEIARAIFTAFHYEGRPYDFNFDFLTDSELVCSELVYKAYEPNNEFKGLTFPLKEMLGRHVTPPNEMAKQFTLQYGTADQQTDLVLFYDAIEHEKKSIPSTVQEFNKSWMRPKWHILKEAIKEKTS